MNVINVVGNAIGVYVLKLGVAGVAIPSLVSRGVAGVVLFTLLHNPDNSGLSHQRKNLKWTQRL